MWKEDKFFTWKGKTITAAIAKKPLENGSVSVKGLKKKDGGAYGATITADFSGEYVAYKLEFEKK